MKYEDRIQSIAEEMAEREFPKQKKRYNASRPDIWMTYVIKKTPDARIAVKHMAEAARHACYESSCEDFEMVERYLKEQGLIPDDGQEAVKDVL